MRAFGVLLVFAAVSACARQHVYTVHVVDRHGKPVRQALVRMGTVRPWPTGSDKLYVEQGQADNNGTYHATTDIEIERILADSPDLKHSGYVDFPGPSGTITVVIQ